VTDKTRRTPAVDDLRPHEAMEFLRRLWERRGPVGEAVRRELELAFEEIDAQSVALEVRLELEALDVDELFERSGDDSYGDTDLGDAAWHMIEEALAPYVERIHQFRALARNDACDGYTLGILQGIYAFDEESETDFKAWLADDARKAFDWVIAEWHGIRQGATERQAMKRRLVDACPAWSR
jgi:hypothetical protein